MYIYESYEREDGGETLEDPMAERADPLGRRQATTRKQGSTLSRVPGPVRNTTTRRRAESTLDSGFPYSVLMSRRLCRP